MKRKVMSVFLVMMLTVCLFPGLAAAADDAPEPQETAVSAEQSSEPAEDNRNEEPAAEQQMTVETADTDNDEEAAVIDDNDNTVSKVALRASPAKDVYIDNTIDNSVSYVTGSVHITGSGGKQAGYDTEKVIYEKQASVTYSNPKTAQVQGLINDSYTSVYKAANDIKSRGKSGEFHMSTSESPGKVWDNRKYTTVEDGDAVLIGDSDYLQGAYGVDDQYTRTHIASGDYGKETYYRVEANGWVRGFDITVTDDGNGKSSADLETSLAEETVTLTAKANDGYVFKEWQVISGGAVPADASASATSFVMPKADVEIKAVFESVHSHTLVKTGRVDPTCEKEGTEEYWTCSECGEIFSDAAGTDEIETPAVIPALGHNWGEWIVDREATEDEEGEQHRVCANDPSHVEIQSIPRIDNTDSDASDNNSSDASSSSSKKSKGVDTGDESLASLWSVILTSAFMALALLAVSRKREER